MKAMDLRTKTPDELTGMLADLKKEQFNLRFQKASGQLENTARVRTVRRTIAQIRTILGQQAAGKTVAAKPAGKPAAKKAAPKKAPAKKVAPAKKPAAKKAAAKPAAKKAPAKKAPAKKAPAKKK